MLRQRGASLAAELGGAERRQKSEVQPNREGVAAGGATYYILSISFNLKPTTNASTITIDVMTINAALYDEYCAISPVKPMLDEVKMVQKVIANDIAVPRILLSETLSSVRSIDTSTVV